jgi:D-alanyl-D-alanine carboxypeptidase
MNSLLTRLLPIPTAAALLLSAACASSAAPAADPAPASVPESAHAGLQRRLDEVRDAGAVGVLAEVHDERGDWRGTSGVAERGTDRPVSLRSRFRAGSITKTFVAVVVLQRVDEGRLRLDDPVARWLPGVVPHGKRIRIRQLLDHTSGIFDYRLTIPLPPSEEFLANRWRTWTAAEQIARAVARPPVFEPPGSAFSYSNTNYLILGEVVEAVTGRPYGREVTRRVIRPLHLHATTMPGTSVRIPGPHLHGYAPVERDSGLELVDFTRMNPSLFGAGGELISTARDLDRFFVALLGGRLLPPYLLAAMETPGADADYGLGLAWRDTSCGVRVYGNDGDALSYQSWSFSTSDLRRRATLALTPDFRGDADDAVDAFLDEAFCG